MATELFQIFGRIGLNGVDDVNSDLTETTQNAEGSSNKMTSAFKKIGAAVAAYFATEKIIAFGKACVAAASDVAAEEAAFEQIMGTYADSASEKMNAVADATGITNTRLTGYMTSLTAKFKGLGYDVEDATSLAARGLNLAADGAAFWDMSLDESTSHLNSFINGSYEGGEAIGLFANDTQMAAYAVEQGLIADTKAWSSLDEATKQATRLQYAENMYKLSGATGQAAKESDAYLNVQGNLSEAWRQFKAVIGEPILNNIVIPAMQKLNEILPVLSEKVKVVIEWVKTLWNWYKEHETLINTLAIAIGVFVVALNTMNMINTVVGWFNKLKTAAIALNATLMANPIALVIAAIAALVAAFIYLWNNCEAFRNFWKNLWDNIKSVFSAAWNSLKTTLQNIANFFTAIWNGIKAVITGVVNAIQAIITGVWNAIKTVTTAVWNGIKTVITTVVNAIKTVITSVWNGIKTVTTSVWNGIKTAIMTPINAAKTAVTNTINGIKNTVTSVFNGIKTTATNIWNGVKNAISTPIEAAKNKVKSVIDSIKGFFNFKFTWPKLKMPHFGINPKGWKIGDLLKGEIPKLAIDWYAKGGILTKPTLFGVDETTGKLMAGGEAGHEAVAPIDVLQGYVADAVHSEVGVLETYMRRLMETIDQYLPELANKQIVLDSGELVGAMAGGIDSRMGSMYRRKERGG